MSTLNAIVAALLLTGTQTSAAAGVETGPACSLQTIDVLDGSRPGFQLVDIRRLVLADEARIPGAIPLPRLQVEGAAGAPHWLLIGDGLDQHEAMRTCHELSERGLGEHVSVLRGGIRAWRDAGRPLWGATSARDQGEQWSRVVAAASEGEVEILALRSKSGSGVCPLQPGLTCLGSLRELRREVSQAAHDAVLAVVVDDKSWAKLARLRLAGHSPDLLRVSGDLAGLQQYLDQQHAMANASTHSLWMSCQTH